MQSLKPLKNVSLHILYFHFKVCQRKRRGGEITRASVLESTGDIIWQNIKSGGKYVHWTSWTTVTQQCGNLLACTHSKVKCQHMHNPFHRGIWRSEERQHQQKRFLAPQKTWELLPLQWPELSTKPQEQNSQPPIMQLTEPTSRKAKCLAKVLPQAASLASDTLPSCLSAKATTTWKFVLLSKCRIPKGSNIWQVWAE